MDRYNNRSSKGFTLIELLVVIAIIALLLSIIMPSLKKAKEKAREVICKSNLKQWGMVAAMYAEDNDGKMITNGSAMNIDRVWMTSFRDYYQTPEIKLCPSAAKVDESTPVSGPYGSGVNSFTRVRGYKNKAWGQFYPNDPSREDDIGGYTINSWAQVPTAGFWEDKWGDYFWRNTFAKGGSMVPLFTDGMSQGLNPCASDGNRAPTEEDEMSGGWTDSLRRVCTDRHNGAINVVFLDRSVKKVGLKGIWKLKWNRQWDTGGGPTGGWNSYMDPFNDKIR